MDLQRDLDILKYLLEQISAIEEHTVGYDEELFLRDTKTKDAVLTRLVAIGEYGFRIDDATKNRFSEVDWKAIKAARNYYVHVYRGVDWILVWHVVINEVVDLRNKIQNIVSVLEKENNAKTN